MCGCGCGCADGTSTANAVADLVTQASASVWAAGSAAPQDARSPSSMAQGKDVAAVLGLHPRAAGGPGAPMTSSPASGGAGGSVQLTPSAPTRFRAASWAGVLPTSAIVASDVFGEVCKVLREVSTSSAVHPSLQLSLPALRPPHVAVAVQDCPAAGACVSECLCVCVSVCLCVRVCVIVCVCNTNTLGVVVVVVAVVCGCMCLTATVD